MRETVPILEVGAKFALSKRVGTVLQVRRADMVVLWEEYVDPETGEIFPQIGDVILHGFIEDADKRGALRILSRPSVQRHDAEGPSFLRSEKEIGRQNWRRCHVMAAENLIAQGILRRTRASFVENAAQLLNLGEHIYRETCLRKTNTAKRRGGAAIDLGQQHAPPTSAAQVHKWYLSFDRGGADALFDDYARSGNRRDRHNHVITSIAQRIIETRLDEERPTVTSITDSVRAACIVHYDSLCEDHRGKLPGYDFVHGLIDAIAPAEHAIRTRGFKVAYKDMHSLGVGITTTRAFERVEIDEYDVDLNVLLNSVGVWDWLTEDERVGLGLNGDAKRVKLSAAIDVHTRCIGAMRISAGDTTSLARDTIEMLLQDKTPVADALGAHDRWDMFGCPEAIVIDRGPTYVRDEFYDLLAGLGIDYQGAPSRKPWLRPFIERLFRTIHNGLLQRFSGRTFSNVVAKGENKAEERASITLPEFLQWLVRWVVDVYHNTPHRGLGGRTPAEAWRQAIAVHRPRGVTRDELRRAFGIKRRVKLGRKGLRVMHIDYQSDELAEFCNRYGMGKTFEVFWWPADIGVVLMRVSDDHWLSVPAADKQWVGKSFEDLERLRHYLRGERAVSDVVRAKAIQAIDAAAQDGKIRRGLLPHILNAENFDTKRKEVAALHGHY